MSTEGQVAPSRMTLQIAKQKKKGANQGYQLLKKKSDALSSRFRGMLKDIVKTKLTIGECINEAHFSMAKATWAGGNDLRGQLMQITTDPTVDSETHPKRKALRMQERRHFASCIDIQCAENINLSAGGHVILAARDKYLEALAELVKLASLQVVLPKLDRGINYITKELDEMEREEFFRLKKIQEKKKNAKDAEMKAIMAADKESRAHGVGVGPTSILAEDDEDLVF